MAAVAELSSYRSSQAPSSPSSPKRRERPLPPLPTDDEQREPSPPASPMIPKASAVALGKRRAAPLAAVSFSEGLSRMVHDPSMLSALLGALQWPSFHALISTCRTFRRTFTRPELRDVIFSRFVPGYSFALGSRQVAELSVDITIEDLALFGTSSCTFSKSPFLDTAYTRSHVPRIPFARLPHACSRHHSITSVYGRKAANRPVYPEAGVYGPGPLAHGPATPSISAQWIRSQLPAGRR